jgi:hypothetical protein
MEPKLLLETDFIGILNFKTFSLAPSIINEKVNNVLFHLWMNFFFGRKQVTGQGTIEAERENES